MTLWHWHCDTKLKKSQKIMNFCPKFEKSSIHAKIWKIRYPIPHKFVYWKSFIFFLVSGHYDTSVTVSWHFWNVYARMYATKWCQMQFAFMIANIKMNRYVILYIKCNEYFSIYQKFKRILMSIELLQLTSHYVVPVQYCNS